ncbi:MAG TPA: hypothetical protein VK762_30090 [Polyangiaceae bacterium]|nr:hypothetical protein [Polyangiaceae bacterium]
MAAGLAGLLLVGGVAAWRLASATYRGDLAAICHAEARSGLTIARDMPALNEWMRGQLATREGNELLSTLHDTPADRRASRLRDSADAAGIGPCPLAQSYDSLVADADYRADLQRLCSLLTFPDLAASDDPARLDALEDWIDTQAGSARTKALAGPLRSAATPAERANVLRVASREMDVFTCDVARTIETPPPAPDAGE